MFDYVVFTPNNKRNKPRYFTAGFSIIVHVLVLGFAIGLPILYASDALPEPPDMMAFVVEAPPPPPPPPPPAPPPPEAKKPDPSPNAEPLPVAKPVPVDTVAAPVEAPTEVKPETGMEGAQKTAVEAGFEKGVAGGVAGGVVGGLESAPPPPPPPPPPPKPQGPVRVGGQIKAPQLTNRVNPMYPPAAQAAQVGGNVVLEATVDKTGHVTNVKVLQGQPLLNEAAIAAVKQWSYAPLMLNGEPTPFILTVTVTFSIPK